MKAASRPRAATEVRILVVDGTSEAMRVVSSTELATLFEPGDVVVVNDAGTLPASLAATTSRGESVELRLVGGDGDDRWTVALLGRGDYRTRTEDRPPPPHVAVGEHLDVGASLRATVVGGRPESDRLVEITLSIPSRLHATKAEVWAAFYRVGKPVQYAHVPEPLALWDVQNVYASRPWAAEMPSAGRALRFETLLELGRRGVDIARVTHAAGLSSIGDADLDSVLPLPERYEVTEETWSVLARARRRGGRVVAIGTSTARALEGGARDGKRSGTTDLRIGPKTRRSVVDAVMTGIHEVDTSHFELLRAFVRGELLQRALARAEEERMLGHEMGDACLIWAPRGSAPEAAKPC